MQGILDYLGIDDIHSTYMENDEYNQLNIKLDGTYEGLGISAYKDDKKESIVISSIMPDSPASKLDLKENDEILSIDNKLTKDMMFHFQKIAKPPLAPPGFLFPIVWTILYILLAISIFLIYKDNDLLIKIKVLNSIIVLSRDDFISSALSLVAFSKLHFVPRPTIFPLFHLSPLVNIHTHQPKKVS